MMIAMQRREFLESIGALGGLFATGAMTGGCRTTCSDGPLAAAQKTFSERHCHERLSLAYRHVKIGLEKPFSILHISVQDRFSPTAMEYVTGANFMFHGQEVMFS